VNAVVNFLAAADDVPCDYIGVQASAGDALLAANLAAAESARFRWRRVSQEADSESSCISEQLREWLLHKSPANAPRLHVRN
jgi:hypothetical protein